MTPSVASVVVDASIDKMLDYRIPDRFQETLQTGFRVSVPIRGRMVQGTVVELKERSEFPNLKEISDALPEEITLTEDLLKLALWIAKYYCCPLGKVVKMMLPSSVRNNMKAKEQLCVIRKGTLEELRSYCTSIRSKHPSQALIIDILLKEKKRVLLSELLEKAGVSKSPITSLEKKGLISVAPEVIARSPLADAEYFRTKPKKLNEEQQACFDKIAQNLLDNTFSTHLIHGVTGSGKTEVYLQSIQKALDEGKGAIMLVPEISLTTQMVDRFRSRFEHRIAVLHHRLSHGERVDEWKRIRNGEAKIAIGARSAIFSPVQNLGLIIVDEEHEQSYKQSDDSPCYHAREAAIIRGSFTKSVVILGSATPSVESYYNASTGKYVLSKMTVRADKAVIPKISIVDMRLEDEKCKHHAVFSEQLLSGIKKRVELGEQAILFLNRRGYHTSMLCKDCGQAVKCNHCDVTMTFHRKNDHLSCHLCGWTTSSKPVCPNCKTQTPMRHQGYGTEQIERSLHGIFPELRTLRIDADTTKHKGAHQQLLRDFATGKADVLIGTQMIAKGLHFPEVTLVGILNCDGSLNIPDFRASETTFQLITQVAGRAGRGVVPGEVVLQTRMPDNPIIHHAINHAYETFFDEELSSREIFAYPPFSRLAKLTFSGQDPHKTYENAEIYRQNLAKSLPLGYQIYPLIPCGHAKVKNAYRFHFLIKGKEIYPINRALQKVPPPPSSIQLYIDIDPTNTYF